MSCTGMMSAVAVLFVVAAASGGGLPDLCGVGYSQSPISLDRCADNNGHENRFMNPVERDPLTISFGSGDSKLEKITLPDGGKALKITPKKDKTHSMGTFSVSAHGSTKEYTLAYCLVHTGSDHTIALSSTENGRYPAEVQCFGDMTGGTDDHPVHRMGAISVMYANGDAEAADGAMSETSNIFLGQFTEEMFKSKEEVSISFDGIEGNAGLTRYYTYSGSTRLPPCSENVDWYVMYDPAGVSNAQLTLLEAEIKTPAKAMAHHNGRHPDGCPVYHSGTSSVAPMTGLLLIVTIFFGSA